MFKTEYFDLYKLLLFFLFDAIFWLHFRLLNTLRFSTTTGISKSAWCRNTGCFFYFCTMWSKLGQTENIADMRYLANAWNNLAMGDVRSNCLEMRKNFFCCLWCMKTSFMLVYGMLIKPYILLWSTSVYLGYMLCSGTYIF